MANGDLYQVLEHDDVSPLLWHLYVVQVDEAAVLGQPMRTEVPCWHNWEARLPLASLVPVTDPQIVAAFGYMRDAIRACIRDGKKDACPAPYGRFRDAALELHTVLYRLSDRINEHEPVGYRTVTPFLTFAELTNHLKQRDYGQYAQYEIGRLWERARELAGALEQAEGELFR